MSPMPNCVLDRIATQLQIAAERVERTKLFSIAGKVRRATGLVVEATGLDLPVGEACQIDMGQGQWVQAEIVGFHDETFYLMPHSDISGLPRSARVLPAAGICSPKVELPATADCSLAERSIERGRSLPVGWSMLGRVVDANGRPLDGLGDLAAHEFSSLVGQSINPLQRAPIDTVLDVGVRAINGLLTVGRGQRMGLFAGSGVGKSVLLGMMARCTQADVIVVGLIGERGREVQEFIEHNLGEQGLQRAVVVAAPADVSPLLRMQGAAYCTRIAEFFRDQGKHVLLIMDSLTRYAMAQREIALAIGEPPATKGYPPSVFAKLPALVERAGMGASINGREPGSITAFYTVLTEGDDQQDPIADSARAILDGHIVLSRSLAEAGHYPAIDIEASISRVMHALVDKEHYQRVNVFKQLFSTYQRNRDLVAVGAYTQGNDPMIDLAIQKYPALEQFLRQSMDECVPMPNVERALREIFESKGHHG